MTKIKKFHSIEGIWDFLQKNDVIVVAVVPYTKAGLLGTSDIYLFYKEK